MNKFITFAGSQTNATETLADGVNHRRGRAVNARIVGLAFVASLAGCAAGPYSPMATASTPTNVPAPLHPPAGEESFLKVHATGVQIYECAAKASAPTVFGWQFRGPEATLVDANGQIVGRHFAGPSWQATDGSTIVGQVSATFASPQIGSVPWLLLTVKSHSGEGLLAQATSVQRVDTEGGAAPSAACAEGNAHEVARVGYSATYIFWRR